MNRLARNEIYFGHRITMDEIRQKIRMVTRDEAVELAEALFRPEEMTLSLLGDFNEGFKVKEFGAG